VNATAGADLPGASRRPSPVGLALAFCAGVLGAAALPELPGTVGLILICASTLVLFAIRPLRPLAALPLGVVWFSLHAMWMQAEAWPDSRIGERVELEARVVGLPSWRDGRMRVELAPDRAARDAGVPSRVLADWFWPREWFRPGERWRLVLALEPPQGRHNPGQFDYHRYLLARGVGATAGIVAAERVAPGDAAGAPDRFRQRFADWLQTTTVDLDAAALLRALAVADRAAMSPELNDQLRRTGTAHLLSISGLHVGMVAALGGLLAGLFLTPLGPVLGVPDRRRGMLLAGLILAGVYALLAGFTLPTQRALVMLLAGAGALLLRRSLQPGRALLVALVAILLLDPLAPLATGFWLSFGAVAVLLWTFAGRGGEGGWLRGLVRAQIVIAIGLLPLNLGLFQQWAPTALLANLVAIPLVGFWVLPCLLLAIPLFAIGVPGPGISEGMAAGLIAAAEHGLKLLLLVLDQLRALEDLAPISSAAPMAAPGLLTLSLAAIGALWLLAPRGWPARPLGVLLLVPMLWPPSDRLEPGEFELLVPDLGDGQAVLVRTRESALLFGTGPGDGDQRALVEGTLAPLLRQRGVTAPDRIVVPVRHRAYAGGAAEARRRWPEAEFIGAGQPLPCVAGQSWTLDRVTFRWLHPNATLPDLGRDSGCVLEIRSAAGSALLTGGISRNAVRRMRLTGRAAPVDALLVPAMGHRDALDDEWLAVLDPALAIATVARPNRRALPHAETAAALQRLDASLLTTGDCGALRIRISAGRAPEVIAERLMRPRFWRRADRCAEALGRYQD